MKNFDKKKNKINKADFEARLFFSLYNSCESADIGRGCLVELIAGTGPRIYTKDTLLSASITELKKMLISRITLSGIRPGTKEGITRHYGNEYTWN